MPRPGHSIKNIVIVLTVLILITSVILIINNFSGSHDSGYRVKDIYEEIRSDADKHQPEFKKEGEVLFLKKISGKRISAIEVEVADTPEQTTKGLMYRKSMDENKGMLFIFDEYRQRRFHMKNTIIPLDIIFADSTGRIVKIHKNTIPFSETKLYSEKPVKFTVEVNAGYTDKHQISEEDRVSYSLID